MYKYYFENFASKGRYTTRYMCVSLHVLDMHNVHDLQDLQDVVLLKLRNNMKIARSDICKSLYMHKFHKKNQ